MRVFLKFFILAWILVVYIGIFPRHWQHNAPTIFMLVGAFISVTYMIVAFNNKQDV